MALQISAFLLFVIFTAGHSLSCYQCRNNTGSCVNQENTTCSGSSQCMSVTTVWKVGQIKGNGKYCNSSCVNGSLNYGTEQSSYSCCDTDLCNIQDAPDPSTNAPNGKICYYCDGQNCSNTVNCSGTEDRCFTETRTFNETQILKGCVSKSFCNYSTNSSNTVNGLLCCEGNLCNGISGTQNITTTPNFTQNFTQNITQNFTQNFTQNITQNFTQNFTQNITQNFTQNFTQNITITQNFTQNVTQNFTQNFTITQNFTQNFTITPNVPQSVPHSTNSARSITQSFLLLLTAYLSK